jgi:hypothetical protein
MANNKREITQRLLALIPDQSVNLDQALKVWYMNIRDTGGLRLTAIGYTVLRTLDIESWNMDLDPKKINKKTILELDRKLQWPYYIDTKKRQIIFFSSREAMLATLYGDLGLFLKQYS